MKYSIPNSNAYYLLSCNSASRFQNEIKVINSDILGI